MKQVPFSVTFLGTGTSSGVPMIACNCIVCKSSNKKDKRLRSSILVQTETTSIVIDSGPDFRQQMLTNNVQRLDAVLFTHPHKDHIAGLDDIRAFNFFQQKKMMVYCNTITKARLLNEFDYAFAEIKYEGVPLIEIQEIDLTPFNIGDIYITPILVWHMKMPVYGYRIGDFTYITDANRIEENELDKIMGTNTIVLNALRKEPHVSHFTLQEAVDIANKLQASATYFTHISHQLGLHETINKELPNHIKLAHDELHLTFC